MREASELPAATPEAPVPPAVPRGRLWLEIGVVLALVVVPAATSSVAMWFEEEPKARRFTVNSFLILVTAAQVSLPVLYIIGRSGEPWSNFGLGKPIFILDVPAGLAVWCVADLLFHRVLPRITAAEVAAGSRSFVKPSGFWQYALLAGWSAANGFAEELVLRGFLLHRFRQLCESAWPSLFLTSVLFGVYHLHYGPVGALDIMVVGGVYGLAVLLFGRIWPAALAHAIHDFIAAG